MHFFLISAEQARYVTREIWKKLIKEDWSRSKHIITLIYVSRGIRLTLGSREPTISFQLLVDCLLHKYCCVEYVNGCKW